jgi:hypothetical protein
VALIGLYKSEVTALWFAVAAGIVVGSQSLNLMPWEILILTAGAIFANQVKTRVNLESITSKILVIGALVLTHQIFYAIVSGNVLIALYKDVIPTVIYTLIIGWLFFQVKDGHITWQKIKALF